MPRETRRDQASTESQADARQGGSSWYTASPRRVCWMDVLGTYLRTQGKYKVFNVEYASTRECMADHARSLANVIRSLEGIDQIDLVGYSMGNVVIRRYLAGYKSRSGGWQADPRIHRIVMIAPPNHGSITAKRLSWNCLFKAVMGTPAVQLGADWEELVDHLATPKAESSESSPVEPAPAWDSVWSCPATTTVESASVQPDSQGQPISPWSPRCMSLIAHDPRVLGRTLRFLQKGYFISPERKQPIKGVASR